MDGVIMTPSMKVGIAGIVLGLILLAILPAWAAIAIIVIAAAQMHNAGVQRRCRLH
jgi:hypothetical protein